MRSLLNRSCDSSEFILSTILARDAEVVAVETGCRGLELLSAGDFFGGGAMILAFSKGLVTCFCPISLLLGDLSTEGDGGRCLVGVVVICCTGFGNELAPLGATTLGVLYRPRAELALDDDECPESEAALSRRVLMGIRDCELRVGVAPEVPPDRASDGGVTVTICGLRELALGGLVMLAMSL